MSAFAFATALYEANFLSLVVPALPEIDLTFDFLLLYFFVPLTGGVGIIFIWGVDKKSNKDSMLERTALTLVAAKEIFNLLSISVFLTCCAKVKKDGVKRYRLARRSW